MALNFVNRFLVGKATGAANTGTTLATITKGDILVVSENGDTVLDATTAAAAKVIRIARGTGTAGKLILSAPIKRSSIIKYTKQAGAAAVAQVDTFADLNLEAGKEYKLVIVFKDDLRLISNRQTRVSIHHKTPSVGFVEADEVAKIVDKVNKDRVASTLVTAASDTVDGLTLTGKAIPTKSINDYEFVTFTSTFVTVDPNGLSTSSDVYVEGVTTTKASGGQGLPAQLAAVERYALGYLGQTDLRDFRTNKDVPFSISSDVTGGSYDVYHIQHFDKHEGDLQGQMESPVQTSVAVATGSAQGTALEAILDAFVDGYVGGAAVPATQPANNDGE